MITRRGLLGGAAAVAVGAAVVPRSSLAAVPEAATSTDVKMQVPPLPSEGPAYNPVVTLNGWSLPFRIKDGWKEFHLVAEPVVRELAPGMNAHLWGYNGQSPGPTIEMVEGEKVRIYVTNRLPEHTTVHWHGVLVPNGMDGVGGVTQPHIKPGETFVYEFIPQKSGTHMYHPHSDEMVQMAMGMMGSLVIHTKDPESHKVDRDFVFVMNSHLIEPGTYTPKVAEMLDFNMWTWNSRIFPGIDPLAIGKDERARIRIGNLSMTSHPIHLHGHVFTVAGTDGGWVPETARWPEVTVNVPPGQMRAIEFVADNPGDWAFHCHKTHHAMNAMGHQVPTMIGADLQGVAQQFVKLVPDAMIMGTSGMGDMGQMEKMMPMPKNTLPMMTGTGPFGPIEMGGMFTVVKIREGLPARDFRDPGWYRHPEGTVAWKLEGSAPPAPATAGSGPAKASRPQSKHKS